MVVGPRERLLVSAFRLHDVVWHLAPPGFDGLRCVVRPRHRSAPLPATVHDDGRVQLDQPTLRPAPGQVCAIYDPADDLCLGGGWVS